MKRDSPEHQALVAETDTARSTAQTVDLILASLADVLALLQRIAAAVEAKES
jgi:hypothetical protein